VLIARYLSQAAFGAFAVALSYVTLFETIVTLGLDRGIGRFLAIYDERGDRARLLGTLAMILGTVISVGLAVVLLVLGVVALTGGAIVGDATAAALLVILVVLGPIQAADNLFGGALAVFADARAIFVRKYLVGPGLRLVVVLLLIGAGGDVTFLAIGYVLSGALGLALYGGVLVRALRTRGLLSRAAIRGMSVPVREILLFTTPLVTTDLVYLVLNTTDAILLGASRGPAEVADYRVIQPLVHLNMIVYSSFTLLYTPAASRLFAREDRPAVAGLYWTTAIWIAVLSFPIFALTTSLAEPVTVFLFQERYAGSAVYLAILAVATYFNVALGFNGLTLRVFGLVRYTVIVNIVTAVIGLGLNLVLIPAYGALGAAIGTASGLILFNVLKQLGLRRGTGISVFDRRYAWVYAVIGAAAIGLAVIQVTVRPGIVPSLVLATLASLVVLALTRRALDVAGTFPEILRLPLMRRILGVP
jgi:O-antigen/teichoic acid export membrane protein